MKQNCTAAYQRARLLRETGEPQLREDGWRIRMKPNARETDVIYSIRTAEIFGGI